MRGKRFGGNNKVILQSWESRDEGSSLSFEDAQAASEQTRQWLNHRRRKRKREWGLISGSQDLYVIAEKCVISKCDKSRGSHTSILFRDRVNIQK